MAHVEHYIVGPYEGVSQVDPTVRLAGACEEMEDCVAIIPGGVQKRPPFTFKKRLLTPGGGIIPGSGGRQPFWHDIDRGSPADDLTLLLNIEAGVTKAYLFQTATMAALTLTVTDDAQAYLNLNAPVPNRDFRVSTIEDVTFVTNRTVQVELSSDSADARPFEGIIWCKTHGYARKTVVTVASASLGISETATFGTHSGSNSNDPLAVGTDKLARALYDGTQPGPVGNSDANTNPLSSALAGHGFTVVLDGSLIYISHPTADFTIAVADDVGGTGVTAIKGSVQRFSDLPALAQDGFTIRIAQEAAGGNSDYYVQFEAASSSTVGTWKEVIAPGASLGADPLTLPLYLREVASVWTLDVGPWTGRTTGTAALSPDPSYVGDYIKDISWWNGRLAFLAGGSLTVSASDDPYKFYTTTLASALASDPIGYLPPFAGKRTFLELAAFEETIVALAPLGQAYVRAGDALTADTSGIKRLSAAQYSDQVPVQTCGAKVYFTAPSGNSMMVLALGTDRISGQRLPAVLTVGVPTYLPNTVDVAATLESEFITLYGTSGGNRIICHTYRHDKDGEQVQNSWSGWNLPDYWTLAGMYFKGPVLEALLLGPDGYYYSTTLSLAPDVVDVGGTIRSDGDLRVTESGLPVDYSGGVTTFTLPYPVTGYIAASVRTAEGFGDFPEAYTPIVHDTGANTIGLQGDWRGARLWFGFTYSSYFVPTKFFKRAESDGNVELSGRLTIKTVRVTVKREGYLRVEVSVRGRTTQVPFEGLVFDNSETPYDQASVQNTGIISVPVGGRNTDSELRLVSDTWLGFKVLGMTWEGSWTPRARRVG